MAEIDEQLAALDGELARYEQLVADRERLVAARAALLGEDRPAAQITWQDVAAYLVERPGSRAGEIAGALGVPLARVSSHLYRGKRTRFVSRADGWHVREPTGADSRNSAGGGR